MQYLSNNGKYNCTSCQKSSTSLFEKIVFNNIYLGIFHEEVVGTVALSTAEADSEMRILDNLDQQLYWTSVYYIIGAATKISSPHTGGIPYDGVPISEIVTVSVPVTVIFTIAGVSGIGFAAFFGAFNFIYRKKRLKTHQVIEYCTHIHI